MNPDELDNEIELTDLVGLLRTEITKLAECYRDKPMFTVEEATVEVGISAERSTTREGGIALHVVKFGGSHTDKSGHQCKLSLKLKPYKDDSSENAKETPKEFIGGNDK